MDIGGPIGIQSVVNTSYTFLRNWSLENLRTWHHPADVEASKYLSLALVLSQSCFTYMRSPTLREWACGASPRGALERELGSWLDSLTSSWHLIRVRSARGSCSPVIWSRCVHISREDKPSWWIRELRMAVAKARVNFEMGPPSGEILRISNPNSCTALSATGFLFLFLALPGSMNMPYFSKRSAHMADTRPGAGSTLMWVPRSPKFLMSAHNRRIASDSSSLVSRLTIMVNVYDVSVSRSTTTHCL